MFGAAGGAEDDGFALTADPENVVIDTTTTPPEDSGTSMITATVLDPDTDDPLEGVEVTFSADAGELDSGGAPLVTDANGMVADTLLVRLADPDEIEVTATENSADRPIVNDEASAAAVRELVYAVQLGCVLDLVFKDDATFRALPPKAVGREPAVNWALGLYLDRRDN